MNMRLASEARHPGTGPPPAAGEPAGIKRQAPFAPGTILIFMQDLEGGGAERVALLLANRLAEIGHRIVLVLVRRQGRFLKLVSPKVEVVALRTRRTAFAWWELGRLIRRERPDIVLSHLTHVNVAAVIAGLLTGRARHTVVVEHNQFDRNYGLLKSLPVKLAYRLVRFVYPRAGAVVSVSEGVEEALRRAAGLKLDDGYVIYNPIVHAGIYRHAAEPPDHPWLSPARTVPVVLAVGSLTPQKDYPTLLAALAELGRRRPVRAVICGEGPERPALEAMAESLGLRDVVDFPGFSQNPFALMRAANALVLSSRWEGLPTVLVEGLACGATIVATDCPSGPREILADGRFGYLARVGDAADLAARIEEALGHPIPPLLLRQRAEDFSVDKAIETYCLLFDRLTGGDETDVAPGEPPRRRR
jgi:glycosyltransferase involved in cell wall biosynthesis